MSLKKNATIVLSVCACALLAACDVSNSGTGNVLNPGTVAPPTLQSKQAGLKSTQTLLAERVLNNTQDYSAPALKAVGFSAIAVQPSKNLNQRRLMAMRAAKLDAYRVLAEQIHGAQVDSQTTVAEAMLTSDVLSSAVRGTIMGAETVKIEPKGNDTYIVELSLSQSHLDRLIKLYKQGLL